MCVCVCVKVCVSKHELCVCLDLGYKLGAGLEDDIGRKQLVISVSSEDDLLEMSSHEGMQS